ARRCRRERTESRAQLRFGGGDLLSLRSPRRFPLRRQGLTRAVSFPLIDTGHVLGDEALGLFGAAESERCIEGRARFVPLAFTGQSLRLAPLLGHRGSHDRIQVGISRRYRAQLIN